MKSLIITGSPRSGTSALCRLLNTSDKFCIWDEAAIWHAWRDDITERIRRTVMWDDNTRMLRKKKISRTAVKQKKFTGVDLLRYLDTFSEAEVVGDKYPTYASDFGFLHDHPDVKVVVCVRNPLAVVASQLRRFKQAVAGEVDHAPWETNSYKVACDFAEQYARGSLVLIERFFDRVKVVRYERESGYPWSLVEDIAEFMGVDACGFDVSGYKQTNIHAWRDELDMSEVTHSVKELSKLLGYL